MTTAAPRRLAANRHATDEYDIYCCRVNISLGGERFIERLSASMLAAAGLSELVSSGWDEYVDKVVKLAKDHEQRAALRATLRARMVASPLCDAQGLARAMEDAYREMWRCHVGGVSSPIAQRDDEVP